MLFENQVAIVTAVGAGIGRAIALRLAADGAAIVVSDVNDDAGLETVSLIETAGAGQPISTPMSRTPTR